ncbi:MAG: GGDEF domain-containing protein [Arenimonas sp.]
MSKQRQYLLGFSLAAIILLMVGLVVVLAVQREQKDYVRVQHSYEVINQLDQALLQEREAIASQRDYLLSNTINSRQQFWESRERTMTSLRALQDKVRGNRAQFALVRDLSEITERRLALAAHTIDIYQAHGLAAAQKFRQTNGSFALDEQIHQDAKSLRAEESKLLIKRSLGMNQSRQSLFFSALLGIPVSLLIISIVYWLLRRENAQRQRAELRSQQSTLELHDSIEKLHRIGEQLSALTHYTGMLQSCSDTEEVLDITRQAWINLMPDTAGSIYLLRASRDHAEIVVSWGQHRAPSNALPGPEDCWAMRRHQAYIVQDLHHAVKCAHVEVPAPSQSTTTACLPLSAQGESMGWVYLSAEAGKLPEESILISSTEQLSLALANLRLKEKLKQQSIRDPLTHLFNRRYLEESFERELARCKRRNLPLSLLMIDLDHFKNFNDTHGHPGGDALLSSFGRMLISLCRREDIPCRYGGEEFAMVLPECDLECAKTRAHSLNLATAEMLVKHQNQTLSRVTASIGVATFPEHGSNMTELIKQADAALYRAKSLGRNRTELANNETLNS